MSNLDFNAHLVALINGGWITAAVEESAGRRLGTTYYYLAPRAKAELRMSFDAANTCSRCRQLLVWYPTVAASEEGGERPKYTDEDGAPIHEACALGTAQSIFTRDIPATAASGLREPARRLEHLPPLAAGAGGAGGAGAAAAAPAVKADPQLAQLAGHKRGREEFEPPVARATAAATDTEEEEDIPITQARKKARN